MSAVATEITVRTRATLSAAAVDAWPGALAAAGMKVVAPRAAADGSVEYALLDGAKNQALGKGLPRQSPKAAWFPRTEPILKLDRANREWTVNDPASDPASVVLFGARPCDAAAPGVLAPLFGWDYHDPFFENRRDRLATVTMACSGPVDAACFCTSVGVDPAGVGLGDVLLTRRSDGTFLAEAYTEKGEKLLAAVPASERKPAPEDRGETESARESARKAVARRFDPERVRSALAKRFADPIWERAARACLACGTCAYVCPVCHCFDVQDDLCGCQGTRKKNWDACAFPFFTLHTSGHNPRPDQASRWRQRLSHKFRYYPEKFGRVLCTGCGRCLRLCPGGMDLLADLAELDQGAEAAAPAAKLVPVAPAPVPGGGSNIYRPYRMKIASVRDETPDVRTLKLEFTDPQDAAKFDFKVGQFGLYSAFGEGESTFCIASSPTRKGYIECTFRQAGRVTQALRRLDQGDVMGFRGPYGNTFPVDSWKGRNLLFVAGGIALPPMRCVIQYVLDRRADYGDVTIVYGARTWSDHVYKDELAEWEKRPDVKLWLCIDWKNGVPSDEPAAEGWKPIDGKNPSATVLDLAHRRYTAFVPQLVEAARPSPENCTAILCGPPIMIKFTLLSLKKLGFQSSNVYTTLENRMKCGLGKCGRCNVGPVYVCKEGPVFTAEEIERLPPEM